MPEYILYHDQLVRMKGKSFMSFVCEVKEAQLEAVCRQNGDRVTQSIGLQRKQYDIIAANHAAAPYANATINMAPNFTAALMGRSDPVKSHLHAEIIVTDQVRFTVRRYLASHGDAKSRSLRVEFDPQFRARETEFNSSLCIHPRHM